MKKWNYGYYFVIKTPFTIEKQYELMRPTFVKTPNGDTTVNQIYELCDGLLHLSERVRKREIRMRISEEYCYISDSNLKSYFGFDYKYEELSKEQIIKDFLTFFYLIEPNLKNNRPAYYILNDNKDYTIFRIIDTFKIYSGIKRLYTEFESEEDLIFEGKINSEIREVSLKYADLQSVIINKPKEALNNGLEYFQEYHNLKEKLNLLVKNYLG